MLRAQQARGRKLPHQNFVCSGPRAATKIWWLAGPEQLTIKRYSIIERMVPELIPVLGSQPAGDVSHKPGDRLPLLSTRPAVTLATFKRAATNFAAW